MNDLREVLDYLAAFTDYERQAVPAYARRWLNPDRMRGLLASVGSPQDRLPALHVTGSKGKGSVCHAADAILRAHGLRTGLYTSPHLVRLAERIRMDGVPVHDRELVACVSALRPALDRARLDGRPYSFFDAITAAALLAFERAGVDAAVVEVGMGGRLDSTAAVRAEACVLASVLSDHAAVLGPDPRAIAREKAAIFRPGVPALLGRLGEDARSEALNTAAKRGAPAFELGVCFGPRDVQALPGGLGIAFDLDVRLAGLGEPVGYGRLACPLPGLHQADNLALAVAGCQAQLYRRGLRPDPALVRRALAGLRVPGRAEIFGAGPRLLVDVAHSPESARALVRVIRGLDPAGCVLVCGVLKDRGPRDILPPLASLARRVIGTTVDSPRAASRADLEAALGGPGSMEWVPDPAAAVDRALGDAAPGELVVVAGSCYLAGAVLAALDEGRIALPAR